ncbi:hypothetical protein [Leeuwenhoekiella marinoflava]|uniref:hypothetical protein n=1 Tax=Leeuwenhoekiella marinoflava TaxID=988 RepID=UPI00300110AD
MKYENPSNGNSIERVYNLIDLYDLKLTYTDVIIDANAQQEITCESTNAIEGEWEKINENTYKLIFGEQKQEVSVSFLGVETMMTFDIAEGTGEGTIILERQ